MTKYILLFRPKDDDDGAFARRLRSHAEHLARRPGIIDLWISHTVGRPPRSLLPLRRGPIGCLSLRCVETDGFAIVDDEIASMLDLVEIYRAEEAIPVHYHRTWDDGEETPGVCLLTLFHRRPGVGWRKFLRRWHEGHTALSLKLHPLWHYNRNVVRRVWPDDAAGAPRRRRGLRASGAKHRTPGGYDGIVEEHFRRRSDLINPFRFYGRSDRIVWNMLTIFVDILGFIDLRRIETYLTRETIVQSSHTSSG